MKKIVGISPWRNPDFKLLKEAGIEWVRLGFDFPYRDEVNGELTPEYLLSLKTAREYYEAGFKIMGITPLTGMLQYDKAEKGKSVWLRGIPEWAGDITDDSYYYVYEQACMQIGHDTEGLVDLWQVSNEMDVTVFRGPMNIEQAARYCEAGAKGIKKGNKNAKTSMNPAGVTSDSVYLYKKLYTGGNKYFDYAGIDGYYGSWAPGRPEDWLWCIDEIHRITGAPVLINEWGYSSIGGKGFVTKDGSGGTGSLNRVIDSNELVNSVDIVCNAQAWHNVWKDGHNEAEQAEYLAVCLKMFAEHPHVIGSFIYSWGDDTVCFHCGNEGCPAECGWGITDSKGRPKPAYYAVQEAIKKHYK
jgi:hypothetical protein